MTTQYCVDTQALVWFYLGKRKLSRKAKSIIEKSQGKQIQLLIPTLVLLECFYVSLKDPRHFIFPEFIKSLKSLNINLIPFDKRILNSCYKIPKEIDIHDRIITATALVYKCPLISSDKKIAKHSGIKVVW